MPRKQRSPEDKPADKWGNLGQRKPMCKRPARSGLITWKLMKQTEQVKTPNPTLVDIKAPANRESAVRAFCLEDQSSMRAVPETPSSRSQFMTLPWRLIL